ncbi:MAG: hypothetical protein ACXVRD_01625 [Gaiellaceae bacterium]
MPSRKQRRRRQKAHRHEYEFVYVDDEGQEVAVEESDRPRGADARRNGKSEAKKSSKRQPDRSIRKVDPPSWGRVLRRSAIFAPVLFVAFILLNHKQHLATSLLLGVVYTAFLVPFMYLMDRTMYRTYLRRTGQAMPPRRTTRR